MEELTHDKPRDSGPENLDAPGEPIAALIRRGAAVELELEVMRSELAARLDRPASGESLTDEEERHVAQLRTSIEATEAELDALWERFGRRQGDE